MSKLTIMRGLPGSGKSTKAEEIIAKDVNAVRLNRDCLREMLCFIYKDKSRGQKWSGKKEDIVKKTIKMLAESFLAQHKNVIIDDTNLIEKTVKEWERVALESGSKFEIIDVNTPVEECIRRDATRSDSVGASVIRSMAAQAGKFTYKQEIPAEGKIVICDIDGTLADCDHRLKYVKEEKNWDTFFALMDKDTLREGVASMLKLTYADKIIVIVTGRPDSYRDVTEAWLKKYDIKYDALYMRRASDRRPDYIVKQEILDKHIPKDRVEIVIDDRQQVVTMWRNNGLPVIDVSEGNGDF